MLRTPPQTLTPLDLLIDSDSPEDLAPLASLPPAFAAGPSSPTPACPPLPRHATIPLPASVKTKAVKAEPTTPPPSSPPHERRVILSRRSGRVISLKQRERPKVFESITSMPGLRTYSFEELRIECYLQSIAATGHPPCAAYSARTTIPPIFKQQAIEVDECEEGRLDAVMSSNPLLAGAFTFAMPPQVDES